MNASFFPFLAVLITSLASGQPATGPEPAAWSAEGALEHRAIREASGMAFSTRRAGLAWVVNDSGNQPVLYAVGARGADLGVARIKNARNRDWEDLAAFSMGGRSWLLIADSGDNAGRRGEISLYILLEPEVPETGLAPGFEITPEHRIDVVYEDGPRDCEAVAVDPQEGSIYLLSKRETPAALYVLPLEPRSSPAVARRLTVVPHIDPPSVAEIARDPLTGIFGAQPTALDFAPDRTFAVVLTYTRVLIFPRPAGAGWAEALAGVPQVLPLPHLRTVEALAIAPDSRSVLLTGEKFHAPLIRVQLPRQSAPRSGAGPAQR